MTGAPVYLKCEQISQNPLVYRMSRREIARHRCKGCGVNVVKIGDYCMLSPDIWDRQLGLKWGDNMCIACVEARIGRKLSLREHDFISFPSVEGFPMSDVLNDRIIGDCVVLKSGETVARNSARGKAELKRRARRKGAGAPKTKRPKKQTASAAHARDYSRASVSASVNVGRTTIGFLVDEPGQCVALSADRTLIGTFPNRIAAMAAIKIPDQREAVTQRKAARR